MYRDGNEMYEERYQALNAWVRNE